MQVTERFIIKYEGGEDEYDNAGEDEKPAAKKASALEAKQEKYQQEIEEFNVRDKSGIEAGESVVIEERGCTDVLCLLVFLATLCTMLGLSIYAISSGRPQMLVAPYDAHGNLCGFQKLGSDGLAVPGSADMTGFKYLFVPRDQGTKKSQYNKGLCVKECPKGNETTIQCYPNS